MTLPLLTQKFIKRKILVCPTCHSSLRIEDDTVYCSNSECTKRNITIIGNKIPLLVDFNADSILEESTLINTSGKSLIPRTPRNGFLQNIQWGRGRVTKRNAIHFVNTIPREEHDNPLVLVIGGGARGRGTTELYKQDNIDILAFDIYASSNTHFIADGHNIPIADQSINAVWIQAVLEHVMYPQKVVSEIYRILKPGGIVYAETPFLQNGHEGAYDFTRFTESGHRLLFSKFYYIDSGVIDGIGTVLIWNLRYLVWGLTRSKTLAIIASLSCFWLRFFDHLVTPKANIDSACGVFFLGKKDLNYKFHAKDIIKHYKG